MSDRPDIEGLRDDELAMVSDLLDEHTFDESQEANWLAGKVGPLVAEVRSLRAALSLAKSEAEAARAQLAEVTAQRDEARAEVERLRADRGEGRVVTREQVEQAAAIMHDIIYRRIGMEWANPGDTDASERQTWRDAIAAGGRVLGIKVEGDDA